MEVFVDFLDLNYEQPEEKFEIKVNLNGDNKKSKTIALIIKIISPILSILLFIGIIYCCYKFRLWEMCLFALGNSSSSSSTNNQTDGEIIGVISRKKVKK